MEVNEFFSRIVFGTARFVRGNPEEQEQLMETHIRTMQYNALRFHEEACEADDDYEFEFLYSPSGLVLVKCLHCGEKQVVSYEALWLWVDDLCLPRVSLSIKVKIGAARKRILESTRSGKRARETLANELT